MARKTFVYREGKFVEVQRCYKPKPRIHVKVDSMEPTWHPVTGEVIDSKAKFREVTRASGCVEIGNESFQPATTSTPDDGSDTADVAADLAEVYNSMT